MNDGLKDSQRDAIIGILKKCPKLERARLFGSRAMGTHSATSDVDIALDGNLSLTDQAKLAEKLEQLTIPFKVDLVRVKEISSRELQEHIKKYGVVWYARGDGEEEGTTDEHGWTRMGGSNEVRLGDIADVISGPAFKSAEFVDSPGIRLARGDNVKEGVFYWADKTRYWPEEEKRFEKYKLRVGDVLVGMDGSKVGKNWVEVREDDLPCYLVQRVARIRSKGNVDQKTISFAVSSDLFRNYIDSVKTGSSIPHISHRQIEDFSFPYPGKEKELFVVDLISALDDKIALNRKLNETLEGMARALFQSWFVDYDPVKAKLAGVRHGRDPKRACMAALSGKLRIPPRQTQARNPR
ncbi:MAG: restriction endonuclease subunit S [Opitutales bacterium]|nr:restriction endonuclease subunit S [Opitutales bacterium]